MTKIGKYQILSTIGPGAMGIVYKARDPLTGRMVALKTFSSSDLAGRLEIVQRFYREGRHVGSPQHPNIVTVIEVGMSGDAPFVAMEYLEGMTVQQMIDQREPTPVAQKVGYVVEICKGLEYEHKCGVIHCDIKPSNVIVTVDDTVKIVDFGIPRHVGTSRTHARTLVASLRYMSPQQIRANGPDVLSDIWAVGALSYELLSYRMLFAGENQAALMMNIIMKEPVPLRQLVPDCPADLEGFIARMLCKDHDARFQTMRDVLHSLEPIYERLKEASPRRVARTSSE